MKNSQLCLLLSMFFGGLSFITPNKNEGMLFLSSIFWIVGYFYYEYIVNK